MSALQIQTSELVRGALDELAALDQWVVSKLVDGQKPPFSPYTKRKCSHSNPEHWSSYQTARTALPGFDWLGFVFHEADPYSGVDLDGCRNPETGAIESWAQRIIDMCGSYTEISPSGAGVKIFVRGTLPEQLTHSMGAHKGIEIYSSRRYFTFTGRHLADTPTDIRDAQPALDALWADYHKEPMPAAPRKAYNVSKGAAAAAAMPNIPSIEHALIDDGAIQSSAKDFSCPYCDHTHRKNTLFVFKGRVYSRSPGCIIPQKGGLDTIGLYAVRDYGDNTDVNRIAVLKARYPIQQRQRRAHPATEYVLASEIVEARRRDAQRKREQRQQAADQLKETILGRVAADEAMPWQARELLDIHLKIANQRGWHRASVARLAEMIGKGKRWVQRANEYLIDSYVSRTQPDRHSTAIWTLLETPIQRSTMPETDNSGMIVFDAENDGRSPESILIACEGGEPARANDCADTFDAWQWAADTHSADELSELEIPSCLEFAPTLRQSHGRYQVSDGARFGGWAASAAGAWVNWELCNGCTVEPVVQILHNPEPADDQPGASYTPVELSHAPYTGISKHAQNTTARYALVWESMRRRPDVDEHDAPEQLPLDQGRTRVRPKADRPAALDRYVVELAVMSESELAGELRKHKATLKKHHGAVWLAGIGERLALVEQAIDALGSTTRLHARARSPAQRAARSVAGVQVAFL